MGEAWSPPPVDEGIAEGEVRVWLGMLDDMTGEPVGTLLSSDERDRAARFAFDRDRRRFVAARSLLRRLLAVQVQADPRELRFAYDRYGKPSLATHPHGPAFNLSHSGRAAVVALGRAGSVGVDIEALRPMPDAAEIAERFFASGERQALRSLPASQRERAFFECWTRKEAFIKAVGHGLSHPLDGFEVTVRPGEPLRVITGPAGDQGIDWTLLSLPAVPGFVGALAVAGQPCAVHYHTCSDAMASAARQTSVS